MTDTPKDVRTVARKRLEERRGFVPHVILYIVINAGLVFVWTTTAPDAFFWPVFPILFWGAGVVMHAWSAFFSKPITEADIDREARRNTARRRAPERRAWSARSMTTRTVPRRCHRQPPATALVRAG
jgi:hypothetical protein